MGKVVILSIVISMIIGFILGRLSAIFDGHRREAPRVSKNEDSGNVCRCINEDCYHINWTDEICEIGFFDCDIRQS